MKNTKRLKNIAVLTSGGDAPGMNAAIRAVVRAGYCYNMNVFGIYYGYCGLIENEIVHLSPRDVGGILAKGGTILKTARSEKFKTKEGRKIAYENLKKYDIDGFVVIGGDGSFRGAKTFQDEYDIAVIGIPGTIDNDIAGTDYTIGFDTAVNIALEAIDRLKDTAAAFDRLFIVEVMGRNAGHIALNVAIAGGAEECLIPETPSILEEICRKLNEGKKKGKSSAILVVAEGDELGNAYEIGQLIKGKINYDFRVVVLGHIQRGGAPTFKDRYMASKMGVLAVEALVRGEKGKFVAYRNGQFFLEDLLYPTKNRKDIDYKDIKLLEILSI